MEHIAGPAGINLTRKLHLKGNFINRREFALNAGKINYSEMKNNVQSVTPNFIFKSFCGGRKIGKNIMLIIVHGEKRHLKNAKQPESA